MTVIDLFAGMGGWDLAARELGLDPLGIEHNPDACATREAAGLRTLQADIATLDPAGFAPCDVMDMDLAVAWWGTKTTHRWAEPERTGQLTLLREAA